LELIIEKNTSIKNVGQFYGQLKEILSNGHDDITIDFKEVDSLDLSVITVIKATHKELKGKGKKLMMKNISDRLRGQLYLSGFNI
jgi:anti-anti-sigma regulatory factor